MHMLAVLRKLERKYEREVVIIGVHSAKFLAERFAASLRSAIRRLRVEHPVVNDKDFRIWQEYTVRAWPTLVFVDPQGRIIGKHEGEIPLPALDRLLGRLVQEFDSKGLLQHEPLPWQLHRVEARAGLLYFPEKIIADDDSARLFIADTGHNRIMITGLDGNIQAIVGKDEAGWRDGDFNTSRFDTPKGMALHGDSLFVADTENHAVRRVDLKSEIVQTIAGTGEQTMERIEGGPALETALSSPWDLAIAQDILYIAMAGLHQIWTLDLVKETVSVFAGTGYEGVKDGPRRSAWLAQPTGLAINDEYLYVADSESSAIRSVELVSSGLVHTIVGVGLFEFGDIDGIGNAVRLQHPLGLSVADKKLYVVDSYNHKIKEILPMTRAARTFAGTGRPGHQDGTGSIAMFFEPGGISVAGRSLYVADTNNHAIRTVDLATTEVRTLDIKERG